MQRQKCSDGSYQGARERMRLLGGYLLLSAIFDDPADAPAAPKARVIRLRAAQRRELAHLTPQGATAR